MSALPNHIRDLENAAPVRQGNYPCLILNADFQPLSYFPLSLWSWQDAVKAVFLDRVNVVDEYDQFVRSTNFEMPIPSVVALKDYVPQNRSPAFTRFNLFLRDGFECAYCRSPHELSSERGAHASGRSPGTTLNASIAGAGPPFPAKSSP